MPTLSTPKPRSCRVSKQGTTTAGETAARMNPSINPQSQGNPRRRWLEIATTDASTRHGVNANLETSSQYVSKKSNSRAIIFTFFCWVYRLMEYYELDTMEYSHLNTMTESCFNALGSRPSPALSRMTAKAVDRRAADQLGSKPRPTSIYGTFLSRIP